MASLPRVRARRMTKQEQKKVEVLRAQLQNVERELYCADMIDNEGRRQQELARYRAIVESLKDQIRVLTEG